MGSVETRKRSTAGGGSLRRGPQKPGKLVYCMTILARGGSRLIEDYRFSGHFTCQFMAVQARHIPVSTVERILRPLIVVELSRFPTRGVVTTRAVSGFRAGGELGSVRFLMAPGT